MNTLVRALVATSLFAIPAFPLAAQGVTGRWLTEFDRMIRNENGNISTGEKAKARLTLQQAGDSVTGTWELVDAGTARGRAAPRQLRGTIAGNKVSLSTEVEARRNVNGEESVRKLTVVYDFIVDGDKLEGTMTTRAPEVEMPARPFTAWREKP